MTPLLEISNLAVERGNLRALWDVTMRIMPGERVGLLGANGAGKSTTLGAIIGLYPSLSGEIKFDGHAIARQSPNANVARGIVLVPEGRRLFPEMSVLENLEMGAYLPGPRGVMADSLADVFSLFPVLKDKAAQRAGELSGGQQQMVAIGRAMMSRPRLLLLDEPFLGVAPLLVDEVVKTLRKISARGITVLLVEQNIHRALDFVERAYVVENGRAVLDGSRDELLNDKSFSSKFLGLD
jgi:branched-chain amino acid transport system ATP-binding protein